MLMLKLRNCICHAKIELILAVCEHCGHLSDSEVTSTFSYLFLSMNQAEKNLLLIFDRFSLYRRYLFTIPRY